MNQLRLYISNSRVKKIAIAIFSFILINQLLIYGFKSIMEKSHLMRSDQILRNIDSNPDYIIAGNSHALSIQTQLINNAISVASYGEKLHNSYYKLSFLINGLKKKPKTIILSCDLGMLKYTNIDQQNYQYYWNEYEDALELIQFSKEKIIFFSNRLLGHVFPYMEGEIEIFDYFFASKKNHDMAKLRGQSKIKYIDESETRILRDSCFKKQFSNFGEYYLKKIIELCHKNFISLILIRFPVTAHYNFSMSKCFDPAAYYQSLEKKFIKPNNITLLDYHNIYDENQFRDPDHLKGGEIRVDLTNRIIKDIKRINLKNSKF